MELDIAQALTHGWPNTQWYVIENNYAELHWNEENKIAKPSLAEIEAAWALYLEERKKTEYIEKRKSAYPSIEEQLDMLYWDKMNGSSHWHDRITMIKAEHPKGGSNG